MLHDYFLRLHIGRLSDAAHQLFNQIDDHSALIGHNGWPAGRFDAQRWDAIRVLGQHLADALLTGKEHLVDDENSAQIVDEDIRLLDDGVIDLGYVCRDKRDLHLGRPSKYGTPSLAYCRHG